MLIVCHTPFPWARRFPARGVMGDAGSFAYRFLMKFPFFRLWVSMALVWSSVRAQTLINVDFGGTTTSIQVGPAAVGLGTNDLWNAYSHYSPRFVPGASPQTNGRLEGLRFSDGSASPVAIGVTNAPGVWGNASGSHFFDSYIFAPNGSNLTATVTGLPAGRYHFVLYGHADADSAPEQNTVFSLKTGTSARVLGPLTSAGPGGWKAGQPWQDGQQYVIFKDVAVGEGEAVRIEVAPGAGGVAVLNGLQILSRGSSPPRPDVPTVGHLGSEATNLVVQSIHYVGSLEPGSARFQVQLVVEAPSTNTRPLKIFEGDLALISGPMPPDWRWMVQGGQFFLNASSAGTNTLTFELIARVTREEPWDFVRFIGPPAAVAQVDLDARDRETAIQLLSGTSLELPSSSSSTNGARLHGVLAGDAQVGLRWQSKAAEIAREAVITVDMTSRTIASPSVVRTTSSVNYDVVQGEVSSITIRLPEGATLTRLTGEGVRDWRKVDEAGHPVAKVDFLRPLSGHATLILVTEQAVSPLPTRMAWSLPRPLGIQRESGVWTLVREDIDGQVTETVGVRQINAGEGEWAAYRFAAEPAELKVELRPVEPRIAVADRVSVLLEEARVMYRHELSVNVSQSGIYQLEAELPTGWSVASVTGEAIGDWQALGTQLHIHFSQRLLGDRKVTVQLEQALAASVREVVLASVRVKTAASESADITASAVPGVNLRTVTLDGVRERSVGTDPATQNLSTQEAQLAFRADEGSWKITLSPERLNSRLVAEVFNLVTVGDGLVGGSATVRYAIVNQGVQAFRVRLPHHWRNVEFTGANIRRTDHQDDLWTVALQDKAWGAYTLVLTYDYAFDPQSAALDASGAHPLEVERETGTVAVTAAPGVEVKAGEVTAPLRSLDPTELPATDRALIARPILLAYRYEGTNFALGLQVSRHEQMAVLDAVADRTQLTSVLTEQGEMLTQATFLVKNNERQYQRFRLSPDAALWGVAVNGEPAKADRDGDWVLVNLPTAADRDQVFTVDLNYAQQFGQLSRAGGLLARPLTLTAPQTDVPGTYAQWELFTPSDRYVGAFAGNMSQPPGVNYGIGNAWSEFLRSYQALVANFWLVLVILGMLVGWFIASCRRKKFFRVTLIEVLVVVGVLAILAGMLLPASSKAKAKSLRIASVNHLKQIGIAARIFETDHGRLPSTLEEMLTELGSEKILYHPATGEKYTWLGSLSTNVEANIVLAYGPDDVGRREVLMGDGSVRQVTAEQFGGLVPEAFGRYASSLTLGLSRAPAADGVVLQEKVADIKERPKSELLAVAPRFAYSKAEDKPALAPKSLAGFGGGAMGANGVVGTPAVPLPTVAGLKSLKIEIPKSGSAVHFTRVLNLNGEPARLEFSILSAQVHAVRRSLFQLLTFGIGLWWVRSEWRSGSGRSGRLAVALGLTLTGLGSLLLSLQWLHVAFIALPPLALLAALVREWRNRRSSLPPSDGNPSTPTAPTMEPPQFPGTSTSAASVVVLFALGILGTSTFPAFADPLPLAGAVRMSVNGQAGEQSAQFEATIDLVSTGTNQVVELFGSEAAVQQFTVIDGEARLQREGGGMRALLPRPGHATVRVQWLVNVGGDSTRRTLDSSLPLTPGTRLTLSIVDPDVAVEFPTALSFSRSVENHQTQIHAVLGSSNRLTLSWSPRQSRSTESPTALFAEQASLITLANGVVSIRTTLEFTAPQGEVRSVQLAYPTSQRLVRVVGDTVRTWNISTTNRNQLTVELTKPAATNRVVIETEQNLESLPASLTLAVPTPVGVQRNTGWVAFRTGEELGLAVDRSQGLERVEESALTPLLGKEIGPVQSAWRFLDPRFDLGLKMELLTPRIEVALHHHWTVGFDQMTAAVHADVTVTRAGIFNLRFALPDDIRLDRVESPAMASFAERRTATGREWTVTLKQRTLGPFSVDLALSRPLTNLPPQLTLTGVSPLDAYRVSGFVSATSEPGISLKTVSFTGLAEIPAASLPNGNPGMSGWLAFKRLSTDTGSPGWSLTLLTEVVDSWVRAETASSITIGESFASGRAVVRYDIQNAPIQEFALRVPTGWRNVEITGPGIRRRDQTNRTGGVEWRIELQNKTRGDYRLQVKWEQARDGTNEFRAAGLETIGAERETGTVAFYTRGQVQLVPPAGTNSLLRVEARELPEWAPVPGRDPARLSFRYLRPGWQLALGVRQYQDAALLQALVERARLRTVIAADGQMMTQIELRIRNNGRQSLALTLPSDAEVWSAFVNRDPIRPARAGGQVLIPLEGTDDAGAVVAVELTYVLRGTFPKTRGTFALATPRLDIPLKDAQWELFLPPDYDYADFGGSMNLREDEGKGQVSDYTLSSYQQQQLEQNVALKTAEAELLSETREDLAKNNLQGLGKLERFNRFSVANSGARDGRAYRELKEAVDEVQSSNLIQAQLGYELDNNLQPNRDKRSLGQNYDAKVARLQVAQLNRAQAVITTRVSPLRVNLPTRGLRFNFSQVLQTRPGEPMTVSFKVRNEQRPGLVRLALGWGSAAGVLWFLSAWILRQRQTPTK